MKTFLIISLFVVSLISSATAQTNETPKRAVLDGVAAYVNQYAITIGDIMTEVRRSPAAMRNPNLTEAELQAVYTETLNRMIDRRLILNAATKAGLVLQDWIIDTRVREIVKSHFNGDQHILYDQLKTAGITYSTWRKSIADDMTVAAMRYQTIEKNVSPTPGEIRAAYDANPARFATAASTTLCLIMLAPDDPDDPDDLPVTNRAETIFKELRHGTPFESLARDYSAGIHASEGGLWKDIVLEEVFRADIIPAIRAVEPGKTSDLVTTDDGYGYIIRKISESGGTPPSYATAYSTIEQELREEQCQTLYTAWVKRLRADACLRTFDLPKFH